MRSLVFAVIFALLLLFTLAGSYRREAQAEDTTDVRALVRANPLQVSVLVLGSPHYKCGAIPILVRSRNLGNERLSGVSSRLQLDLTAFQVIAHLNVTQRSVQPGREHMSIWVIRPLEEGDFVLVARTQALLDGEPISAVSEGSLVSVHTCPGRKPKSR